MPVALGTVFPGYLQLNFLWHFLEKYILHTIHTEKHAVQEYIKPYPHTITSTSHDVGHSCTVVWIILAAVAASTWWWVMQLLLGTGKWQLLSGISVNTLFFLTCSYALYYVINIQIILYWLSKYVHIFWIQNFIQTEKGITSKISKICHFLGIINDIMKPDLFHRQCQLNLYVLAIQFTIIWLQNLDIENTYIRKLRQQRQNSRDTQQDTV
jgi:hypothetical protein